MHRLWSVFTIIMMNNDQRVESSSSRTTIITQRRRWSQVTKMEMQSYEYVEISVSGRDLSSQQQQGGVATSPSFSRVSEKLRRLGAGNPTAHQLQCSVFCGGKGCKYENAARLSAETGSAFPELYSHWVTDDVLAMARPSTMLFRNYNLLTKLKNAGVRSIFNLQLPGEHPHCGPGLEPTSGFTYDPEDLMRDDIFFYNYGWSDYGVPSLSSMLDTVKVLDFACESGKVAVHCHAGLGRTGALIACYLVYSRRVSAENAISIVRTNRPGSLQTRGQVGLVQQFLDHLQSLWRCYPSPAQPLTLQDCLDRQGTVLHGERRNSLRTVPLVVHGLCSRLKKLTEENSFTFYCLTESPPQHSSSPSHISIRKVTDDKTTQEDGDDCWLLVSCLSDEEEKEREKVRHFLQQPCCPEPKEHYLLSLLSRSNCVDSEWAKRTIEQIEVEFNGSWEWATLNRVSDLSVLTAALYSYLRGLKEPLLSTTDLASISASDSLLSISLAKRHTLHLILETIKPIMPSSLIDEHGHSLANHIAVLVTQSTPTQSHDFKSLKQYVSDYLMKI